jgi:hypothetical protein
MSFGAKYADNDGIRYNQTTKIIERILDDMKKSGEIKYWLESCNVCACGCGVEAVGGEWKIKLPVFAGKELFSQADMMMFFLYSTEGRARMPKLVDGVKENEVADNLVYAINEISTAKATLHEYKEGEIGAMRDDMIEALRRGSAIALSYLTDYNSGHYIAIVKYDEKARTFMAYDSWAANVHCKNNGVKEWYPEAFIITRARPRFIEISAS